MGSYLCTSILVTNMKAAQQCLNCRHRHWLSIWNGSFAGGASMKPGQYSTHRQHAGLLHGLREEAAVSGAQAPLSLPSTMTIFYSVSLHDPYGVDLVTEEVSCCSQGQSHRFGRISFSQQVHRFMDLLGYWTWSQFPSSLPPLKAVWFGTSQTSLSLPF